MSLNQSVTSDRFKIWKLNKHLVNFYIFSFSVTYLFTFRIRVDSPVSLRCRTSVSMNTTHKNQVISVYMSDFWKNAVIFLRWTILYPVYIYYMLLYGTLYHKELPSKQTKWSAVYNFCVTLYFYCYPTNKHGNFGEVVQMIKYHFAGWQTFISLCFDWFLSNERFLQLVRTLWTSKPCE